MGEMEDVVMKMDLRDLKLLSRLTQSDSWRSWEVKHCKDLGSVEISCSGKGRKMECLPSWRLRK